MSPRGPQPWASESPAQAGGVSEPGILRAQAMRLSTYDKPRIIACAEDHPQQSACREAVSTR